MLITAKPINWLAVINLVCKLTRNCEFTKGMQNVIISIFMTILIFYYNVYWKKYSIYFSQDPVSSVSLVELKKVSYEISHTPLKSEFIFKNPFFG